MARKAKQQKTYTHKWTGEKIGYWSGEVPFSSHNDHPLDYEYGQYYMKPSEPFLKGVTFLHFERGRSAARAVFKDAWDQAERPWTCIMFLSDLEDLITKDIRISHFEGTMAYIKRGANYGFKLLELAPPEYDR